MADPLFFVPHLNDTYYIVTAALDTLYVPRCDGEDRKNFVRRPASIKIINRISKRNWFIVDIAEQYPLPIDLVCIDHYRLCSPERQLFSTLLCRSSTLLLSWRTSRTKASPLRPNLRVAQQLSVPRSPPMTAHLPPPPRLPTGKKLQRKTFLPTSH